MSCNSKLKEKYHINEKTHLATEIFLFTSSFLENTALRPSLPGDVLLVWEFIDFMILCKGLYVSSSQRLKSSIDICFLLRILLRNSVVAALEVVSLV